MNIILLGPPGSGKGTLSAALIKTFSFHHIAPGDIFRENIANNTSLGKKIAKIVNNGNLVPDELVTQVVKEYILNKKITDNMIIDGFPRTIGQAKLLENLFLELKITLDLVMYLDVSKDVILTRLSNRWVCPKCGASYNAITLKEKVKGICDVCGTKLVQRADDQASIIETRFTNYQNQTTPLLKFYDDHALLHRFNHPSTESLVEFIKNVK